MPTKTQRKKECSDSKCVSESEVDSFCTKCSSDGYFPPVWSHPLSQETHCTDPFDGTEIQGTSTERKLTADFWKTRRTYCTRLQQKIIEQQQAGDLAQKDVQRKR
jgi:hypothetical protein